MQFLVDEKIFYGIFIQLIIFLWQCSFAISDDRLLDVMPQEYTLEISTNLSMTPSRRRFYGNVRIQVICAQSTNKIVMHAENLKIKKNIEVWKLQSPDTLIGATGSFNLKGQFIINLSDELIGELTYMIKLEFSNSRNNSVGYIVDRLFSEAYIQSDKYAARHIFPCFDEIQLKAKFNIALRHVAGVFGLSSTKLDETFSDNQPEWVREEFKKLNDPMSTYSVTLALTPLLCNTTQIGQGYSSIQIRYCSENGLHQLMDYVCQNILDILIFMSSFLNKTYPLNKFELVQRKGHSDLTEGYGLVITRKEYLMDVINKPFSEHRFFKYEGIKRLCNIMSHQWFGHIVTMDWEDSWFHNGLNIYIQWQCAAEIHKIDEARQYADYKWDIITSFLHIMKREETEDWILMPTVNSNFANEPGSVDINLRAAHLIRFIEFFMGTEKFHLAIQQYLNEFEFLNTNLQVVWDSFTYTNVRFSPPIIFIDNLDMKKVMENWINQNGHPLITVTRNYKTGEIKLSQEPFTVLVKTVGESSQARGRCWTIPLSYRIADGRWIGVQQRQWFPCVDENSPNEINLLIDGLQPHQWLIIDIELGVLCRVHYDEHNWNLIKNLFLNYLELDKITELNRVRIVSDMFTMAKVKKLSYKIVFDTMTYLPQEKSFAVWKVAIDEFRDIRSRFLGRMDLHKAFKDYMRKLLGPTFEERKNTDYNFQDEYPSELNLSILVMEQACTFGVKSCTQLGSEIIKNHFDLSSISNSRFIPHSINKAIHCQEVKKNDSHRDRLWKNYLYNPGISNKMKELVLMALGCSRSIKYLTSYLKSSLDSSIIDSYADRLLIFKSVSLNVKGYNILKKFFIIDYNMLFDQHAIINGVSSIPYWQIVLDATNHQNDLDELKKLAIQQNIDFRSNWMMESIQNAEQNILWHTDNKKSVVSVFGCSTSSCPIM